MDQFLFYIKLGFNHVIDLNGYDHLLFFLVLVVPYTFRSWKQVLWLITVFTVGHTFTLILSVFRIISVKAGLIEFLIPVTIMLSALFNVFTASKSAKKETHGIMLFITLFFGLIHGLGFSNYFKQIIAAEKNKLFPMLEFAMGIELAQILIGIIVLTANFIGLRILRCNRRDWIIIISAIVVGITLPMVIEKL